MSAEVEIIKGAREILSDPKRWTKGKLVTTDGTAVCLIGALGRARIGLTNAEYNAEARAEAFLQEHLPPGYDGEQLRPLAEFNDDPLVIHQDILDLVDKTLADLGGLA
jgi:hypothetical protein